MVTALQGHCEVIVWPLFGAMRANGHCFWQWNGNVGCNVLDFNDFGHCQLIVFALPNNEKM